MAINFFKWVREKLGEGAERVTVQETLEGEIWSISAELYVRELAFWTCVNLIGNAVSKCEFKTFSGGKESKGAEYFLWNYSPNKNQNSSAFLHKWISQLYRNNEALVIEFDGQLLVADSYEHREYALLDDIFTLVTVGDFQFRRSFVQSEVLFVRLNEKNMKSVADGLYAVYQKLIDYGMKSYQKSRGTKGILNIEASPSGDEKFQELLTDLQNRKFKSFAEAENAVLPLGYGLKYTDLDSKTYSNEGTRDIRAMIDDVSDFTAKAFGIPPALLSGAVAGTSEALENFLTFCVDPLVDMLQEEINRKRNGIDGIRQGNYLRIDTRAIRHLDVMNVSAGIEKLISSGVYCINDIRMMMGDTIIEEPWAWKHFITKNYTDMEKALDALKGGENK